MRGRPPRALRQYAVLADGERAVIVGPEGDYAFMCFPGWADDAVFCSLLGGPGSYTVTPTDPRHVWGGHYEDGSLIWHNQWVATSGEVTCREALALPTHPERAVLLRRVIAASGDAEVHVTLAPAAGFGLDPAADLRHHDGVWTGRCGSVWWRWSGAPDALTDQGSLSLLLRVPEGGSHDLVLELSCQPITEPVPAADRLWTTTERVWSQWLPTGLDTVAERDVRHAYAVLHGLTSSHGGMVAAATTSLPEREEAGRNYDYRYAWIRDQCLAAQAVAHHGDDPLLDRAVAFVSERLLADGPELKPAYLVDGGAVPDQRDLDLPGFPGSASVVGNRGPSHFQLDVFGEALLLFAAAGRHDRLSGEHWRAVTIAADALADRRHEPESGIWELPERRRWTHSQLIGVAGLRAVAAIAPPPQARRWEDLADRMLAETDADCRAAGGGWQRAPDDPRPDAALLLPIIRGAVPADDPRAIHTVDDVLSTLGEEHYLYRFRHDDRPLPEAEGAFLLCGFHAAVALQRQGRTVEAARWFERNRSAPGPPGLLTEEFDVVQRQLRGNLPQAFVHAALIEAGHALAG